MELPDKALLRIGEVAKLLGVETHVVRFWQQQFPHIRPERTSSGRFVYSRSKVEQLERIRRLLHEERLTIEGARKAIRSGVAKVLLDDGDGGAAATAIAAAAEDGSALTTAAPPLAPGALTTAARPTAAEIDAVAAQATALIADLRALRATLAAIGPGAAA